MSAIKEVRKLTSSATIVSLTKTYWVIVTSKIRTPLPLPSAVFQP